MSQARVASTRDGSVSMRPPRCAPPVHQVGPGSWFALPGVDNTLHSTLRLSSPLYEVSCLGETSADVLKTSSMRNEDSSISVDRCHLG